MSIQSGNLEEFLTVAEVAGLLKLNQQTIRNWIDQGSLPALRVGRRVRIKRSDLERLLEEGYTAGTSSTSDPGPSAEDFWGGEPIGVTEPEVDPGTEPAVDPGTEPAIDPGTEPAVDPATEQAIDPVTDPATDPGDRNPGHRPNPDQA